MKITWLLQGSFLIETYGYRLLVDPYISDVVEKRQGVTRMAPAPLPAERLNPSYIYCTHNHMDHVDPVGLPEILKLNPEVRVGGPISVQRKCAELGVNTSIVDVLSIGEKCQRGPFSLTPVKAFHSDPESTGILLEADGVLAYFSGDTLADDSLVPQILKAAGGRQIDYAFICINGRLGNMNEADALKTVKQLKAKCAVPMHYGLFAENTVEPGPFVRACVESGIESFELKAGKPVWIESGIAESHAKSLLPEGKKWKLVWHDEFDGEELDRSKWGFRLHLMQRRHNTFTEEGAELDGKGNLHIKLIEKDGQFYSAHLQTGSNYMDRPGEAYGKFTWPVAKIEEPKFMHKYGYYEIRCKLQEKPGWWSAFWLQSPTIGASLDPVGAGVEVDIMENFTRDGVVLHNNHWDGYGKDHKTAGSGARKLEDTPDGFHIFGLDWSKDGYIYYIDGKESWRVKSPVSDREEFLLVSTECNGYRNGDNSAKELTKACVPDAFVVDYVRVYDEAK